MSFKPILFIDVAKVLNSNARSEEIYRSVVSRAYYGAFGYIKDKLDFADFGASTHQKLIENFTSSKDRDSKLVGKKLEGLFYNRKHADYKYHEEFKAHKCQYCIDEAEKIIELFNKLGKDLQ